MICIESHAWKYAVLASTSFSLARAVDNGMPVYDDLEMLAVELCAFICSYFKFNCEVLFYVVYITDNYCLCDDENIAVNTFLWHHFVVCYRFLMNIHNL